MSGQPSGDLYRADSRSHGGYGMPRGPIPTIPESVPTVAIGFCPVCGENARGTCANRGMFDCPRLHADPETTLHPPDDDLLTRSAEWDRVTTRVTEELLDDVDRLVDAGRAPSRSAVIRRAIARYLDGRPR